MDTGDLTPKELEALALIAQGHDAKSAARVLAVSTHTIYERLRRAREKVGTTNSREAARLMFAKEEATDENLVYEKLVLADASPPGAFAGLPDTSVADDPDRESEVTTAYRASSLFLSAQTYRPLRAPGERIFRATKVERLRLIADISSKLAMAFVAVCLAAMIVSTLLQRN